MIGPEVVIVSESPDIPATSGIKRTATKAGEKIIEQPNIEELAFLIAECRSVVKEIKGIFSAIVIAKYNDREAKTSS